MLQPPSPYSCFRCLILFLFICFISWLPAICISFPLFTLTSTIQAEKERVFENVLPQWGFFISKEWDALAIISEMEKERERERERERGGLRKSWCWSLVWKLTMSVVLLHSSEALVCKRPWVQSWSHCNLEFASGLNSLSVLSHPSLMEKKKKLDFTVEDGLYDFWNWSKLPTLDSLWHLLFLSLSLPLSLFIYLFFVSSRANLSDHYFDQRQDRYVLIEDCAPLADYLAGVVSTIAEHSFVLQKNGKLQQKSPSRPDPMKRGTRHEFKASLVKSLEPFLQSDTPSTPPQDGVRSVGESSSDTVIYPLLQLGRYGVRHDEAATKHVLSACSEGWRIQLASGYFNLTDCYSELLLKSLSSADILLASPQVNLPCFSLGPLLVSLHVYFGWKRDMPYFRD